MKYLVMVKRKERWVKNWLPCYDRNAELALFETRLSAGKFIEQDVQFDKDKVQYRIEEIPEQNGEEIMKEIEEKGYL